MFTLYTDLASVKKTCSRSFMSISPDLPSPVTHDECARAPSRARYDCSRASDLINASRYDAPVDFQEMMHLILYSSD